MHAEINLFWAFYCQIHCSIEYIKIFDDFANLKTVLTSQENSFKNSDRIFEDQKQFLRLWVINLFMTLNQSKKNI